MCGEEWKGASNGDVGQEFGGFAHHYVGEITGLNFEEGCLRLSTVVIREMP